MENPTPTQANAKYEQQQKNTYKLNVKRNVIQICNH